MDVRKEQTVLISGIIRGCMGGVLPNYIDSILWYPL